MRGRWKVSCINWGRSGPQARSYLLIGGTRRCEREWDTWDEAMAYVTTTEPTIESDRRPLGWLFREKRKF